MLKNVTIAVLLLFAIVLNGDVFDRLFPTSKGASLSQAEVTLFALHAIQNRYLNKSKLQPEDLLDEALEAIQEDYSEIVVRYDRDAKKVFLQIYNNQHVIEVKRLRDLWDIAVVLRQVYATFEKEYKPEGDRELSDVEYVAVNGILKKLDPHSYIFTPKEFEDFTSSTEGNFGGLGIVISANEEGEVVVVSPMDGTPAERAGILSGDIIVQINDESAVNMALSKAVDRMRGEPGTKVVLHIKRKGVPSVMRFELERAIIKIQSVISSMPEKGIGYIKLTSFMETSYQQFAEALADLRKKGMKSLILDMRNNAGGLLSQAIKISDLFLDKGVIVSTVGDEGKEVSEAEADRDDILNVPVVVMVNEGSASATEIVAAALKKNNRAVVVGRRTFGKGSVQNLFRIPHGGGLKLTIAQYLTPGDISIQTIGVEPDIEYLPSFIDPRRLNLFKNRANMLQEKDLKEHIVSDYLPKKLDKPILTVNYFKPYKTPEEALKENRKEKVGAFKNDEEIALTVDFLKARMTKNLPTAEAAKQLREQQQGLLVDKLAKVGIDWKKSPHNEALKPENLRIEMISSPRLMAGTDNKITFRATYPGAVENLEGSLSTTIPFLKNVEIPFGSFSGSVERTVTVQLPEFSSWRKEPVLLELTVDDFATVTKKESFEMETYPMEMPEVAFSLVSLDSAGSVNGLVEEGEQVIARIAMKNIGKGTLMDGRIQLINVYNSSELFISKGSEPVVLKPGEQKEVDLTFKISTLSSEKARVGISASLYDYKTKYSAGFTIPFVGHDFSCRYEEKQKGALQLDPGTALYADIRMKTKVAQVSTSGLVVQQTGQCGDGAVRLDSGFWVHAADLKATTSVGKGGFEWLYDIRMPELAFDRAPLTAGGGASSLSFSLKGGDVQDVFAYRNNTKIFYYRIVEGDSRREFSVPLQLKEKINRITVIAKGRDRERISSASKVVLFPQGKDISDDNGSEE